MKTRCSVRMLIVGGLAWLCLAVFVGTAVAQADLGRPNVPQEFLDFTRRLQGDSLTICVNQESVLAPFEVGFARAVGDALLVAVEIKEIVGHRAPPILDYRFPLNEDELYILLLNDCQMMTGFLLSESKFADWLTISAPYLEMGFVFAARSDVSGASLADLPASSRIGTKMLSTADIAFTSFNMGQPEALRWRRVPYPNNQLLIDRLQEGELDAILVWEAGLLAGVGDDLDGAGLRAVASRPMTLPTQLFGAVFLGRDAFLRAAVDEAIRVLSQDGTIDRLLQEHGLPGAAPF